MAGVRDIGPQAALTGLSLALLAPAGAIRCGLLPFEMRFQALVLVSALCIGATLRAGYRGTDLGLALSPGAHGWIFCAALTAVLAAFATLEARIFPSAHDPPEWISFAPFYALVSSPCQEIVFRSIPLLIAERLCMSGLQYVLFSSVLFALMHGAYGDALLLVNAFVAGIVWAIGYLRIRSVWPLAASHAVVGTLAFWLRIA